MPRSVVRYFSAPNAGALERALDQFASDNPNWEIVSASHVLIPGGISIVIVIRHAGLPVADLPPLST